MPQLLLLSRKLVKRLRTPEILMQLESLVGVLLIGRGNVVVLRSRLIVLVLSIMVESRHWLMRLVMVVASAGSYLANGALALRDRAFLELLYASGLRVSELTGLDVDDVDLGQGLVRVLGKRRKERVVPFGRAADAALRRWLEEGRPALVGRSAWPRAAPWSFTLI